MRLADFVIDWLFKKNINTIFTVSGGGSIVLCDALALQDKSIMFVVIMNKVWLLRLKVMLEQNYHWV